MPKERIETADEKTARKLAKKAKRSAEGKPEVSKEDKAAKKAEKRKAEAQQLDFFAPISGDAPPAKKAKGEQKKWYDGQDAEEAKAAAAGTARTGRMRTRSMDAAEDDEPAPAAGSLAAMTKASETMTASEYRAAHSIKILGMGGAALPDPATSWASVRAFFEPKLVEPLAAAGFAGPSPIQACAWPVAVQGRDLIAVAKTGSGKTLGFLLPALHRVLNESGAESNGGATGPRVLVLAPTRELAQQIHAEGVKFGPAAGCPGASGGSCVLYGGVPLGAQVAQLKKDKPTVVVATPGRLCDLLTRGEVSLSCAGVVVLDEADRMLDMGFEKQIAQVFAALPAVRQTLFFTATWPKAVRKLAASYLKPEASGLVKRVFVGTGEDAELEANTSITQSFVHATDDEKDNKLWAFLETLTDGAKVVVFANTKRRADVGARTFSSFGTVSVHGDKTQGDRDAALASFVANKTPLMFATDVAARGLDIKGVTHVVNFDMARDVESYVHRIGRTGRAGELGEAVTFWNPDYDKACAPALVRIARKAAQAVPDWLAKFESAKAAKQWRVEDAEKALAAVTSSA